MAYRKLKVFISYAHQDESLRDQLAAHLAGLKAGATIEWWHDRNIVPGRDWEQDVWNELEAADLIILLISSNFLNSSFCNKELTRAMERYEKGEVHVVPVLVSECMWQESQFARLNGLPTDMKPVTSWPIRDEAWTDVARGIGNALSFLESNRQATESRVGRSQVAPGYETVSMSMRASGPVVIDGLRTFFLDVVADAIPQGGYVGWQTHIYSHSLSYRIMPLEVEWLWQAPSAIALRAPTTTAGAVNLISHGELTGLLPPLPRSDYTGPFVRLALQCPYAATESHTHKVYLLAYHETRNSAGAAYAQDEGAVPLPTIGQVDLPGLGSKDIAAEIDVVCSPEAR